MDFYRETIGRLSGPALLMDAAGTALAQSPHGERALLLDVARQLGFQPGARLVSAGGETILGSCTPLGENWLIQAFPAAGLLDVVNDLAASRMLARDSLMAACSFVLVLDMAGYVVLGMGRIGDMDARSLSGRQAPGWAKDEAKVTEDGRHYRLVRKLHIEPDGRTRSLVVMAHDLTELEEERRTAQQAANHDVLTGLLNRHGFMKAFDRQLRLHLRHGTPGALVYFDLDNFKALNDLRGHAAGDRALQEVAAALRGVLRETDLSARLGGDEFVFWLNQIDGGDALAKAHQLLECASQINRSCGLPDKPLSFSIGVEIVDTQAPVTADEVLKRADDKMYAAKRAGKGRVAS